jgi:glucosamine--fructose-6-phosphate aminotransferase (isomerizing)
MNLEEIEKGGYEHFMLKEIYEQLKNNFRGRMLPDQGIIKMAVLDEHMNKF